MFQSLPQHQSKQPQPYTGPADKLAMKPYAGNSPTEAMDHVHVAQHDGGREFEQACERQSAWGDSHIVNGQSQGFGKPHNRDAFRLSFSPTGIPSVEASQLQPAQAEHRVLKDETQHRPAELNQTLAEAQHDQAEAEHIPAEIQHISAEAVGAPDYIECDLTHMPSGTIRKPTASMGGATSPDTPVAAGSVTVDTDPAEASAAHAAETTKAELAHAAEAYGSVKVVPSDHPAQALVDQADSKLPTTDLAFRDQLGSHLDAASATDPASSTCMADAHLALESDDATASVKHADKLSAQHTDGHSATSQVGTTHADASDVSSVCDPLYTLKQPSTPMLAWLNALGTSGSQPEMTPWPTSPPERLPIQATSALLADTLPVGDADAVPSPEAALLHAITSDKADLEAKEPVLAETGSTTLLGQAMLHALPSQATPVMRPDRAPISLTTYALPDQATPAAWVKQATPAMGLPTGFSGLTTPASAAEMHRYCHCVLK